MDDFRNRLSSKRPDISSSRLFALLPVMNLAYFFFILEIARMFIIFHMINRIMTISMTVMTIPRSRFPNPKLLKKELFIFFCTFPCQFFLILILSCEHINELVQVIMVVEFNFDFSCTISFTAN